MHWPSIHTCICILISRMILGCVNEKLLTYFIKIKHYKKKICLLCTDQAFACVCIPALCMFLSYNYYDNELKFPWISCSKKSTWKTSIKIASIQQTRPSAHGIINKHNYRARYKQILIYRPVCHNSILSAFIWNLPAKMSWKYEMTWT